ncbi:hypothetical protein [Rubripirellula amarantea]|uniref:hypothetical protein n=1 Tax=Rubripirellula amarantea TaxID=2527999 RepID=UPI0013EF3412|nr:hypothetical protein [Rubripirellula amarantea]
MSRLFPPIITSECVGVGKTEETIPACLRHVYCLAIRPIRKLNGQVVISTL